MHMRIEQKGFPPVSEERAGKKCVKTRAERNKLRIKKSIEISTARSSHPINSQLTLELE
jgi:hypothetical protein